MFDIDRKTASRLLKISVRTVDRYVALNRLGHEKREGRIWLDKKEIMKIRAQRRVDTSTSRMSIDKIDLVPVDMTIDSEGNTVHTARQEGREFNEQGRGSRSGIKREDEDVIRKLLSDLQDVLMEGKGKAS